MNNQIVELVDYDPIWPDQFVAQSVVLTAQLLSWLAGPIEHVGSTAVPGLKAKPVVDMLALVWSLTQARAALPILQAAGWLFWPEDPNRHYRMWFLRPNPAARTHHLQIIQHDHPGAAALLRFRDALRRDAGLRDSYASLKDRLSEIHRNDRDPYTDAKSAFIREALAVHDGPLSPRQPIT